MNPLDRCESAGHHHHRESPLEIDLAPEPKGLTVAEHAAFQRSLSTDSRGDELDELELDDMIQVDPYNREPSSRKSDKEISRVLDILDNLPRGKDADEH